MRGASMFLQLRPIFFLRRFSSSLRMESPIFLPRNAFSAQRELIAPHLFSYPSLLSISRQLRNPRRLYASSSEPPFPLLHPHLVPKERVAKPKDAKSIAVKEDCMPGDSIPPPSEYMPVSEEELLKQAALKEFQENASLDVPVDPRLLKRSRKRKMLPPKPPKRLYSEEEDLGFMQEALVEARKAAKEGEVPVGAVLVHNNKIIARFHNHG